VADEALRRRSALHNDHRWLLLLARVHGRLTRVVVGATGLLLLLWVRRIFLLRHDDWVRQLQTRTVQTACSWLEPTSESVYSQYTKLALMSIALLARDKQEIDSIGLQPLSVARKYITSQVKHVYTTHMSVFAKNTLMLMRERSATTKTV